MNALAARMPIEIPIKVPEPRKILVVDDDRLVRSSLVEYLEDSGYEVQEAASACQAMCLLAHQELDLVVCDLRMPEIDGITLLRQIREKWNRLPVIVMSGAGAVSDVVEVLRLGAANFLVKPLIKLEILADAISNSIAEADLMKRNDGYRQSLEDANAKLAQNLRILEEDQAAARNVQRNMLPLPTESMVGIRCQHLLMPSLMLSGDFLDYQQLDQNRLLFYMADVSGHGASSAFATILLKTTTQRCLDQDIRAQCTPEDILKTIHAELKAANMGKHLTCFMGIYNRSLSTLTYCIAGHYPRPILKAGGIADFLPGRGMPVGLMEEFQCEQVSVPLTGPFELYCCSDGLLEIMPKTYLKEKEALLLKWVDEGAMTPVCVRQRIVSYKNECYLPDDIAFLSLVGNAS